MKSWNVIHIYGYGESHIIGVGDDDKGFSNKVPTSILTTVTPFIDDLFTHKPADNASVSTQYHIIHVFHDNEVRFVPKDSEAEGFSVQISLLNQTTLQNLVNELSTATPA